MVTISGIKHDEHLKTCKPTPVHGGCDIDKEHIPVYLLAVIDTRKMRHAGEHNDDLFNSIIVDADVAS